MKFTTAALAILAVSIASLELAGAVKYYSDGKCATLVGDVPESKLQFQPGIKAVRATSGNVYVDGSCTKQPGPTNNDRCISYPNGADVRCWKA